MGGEDREARRRRQVEQEPDPGPGVCQLKAARWIRVAASMSSDPSAMAGAASRRAIAARGERPANPARPRNQRPASRRDGRLEGPREVDRRVPETAPAPTDHERRAASRANAARMRRCSVCPFHLSWLPSCSRRANRTPTKPFAAKSPRPPTPSASDADEAAISTSGMPGGRPMPIRVDVLAGLQGHHVVRWRARCPAGPRGLWRAGSTALMLSTREGPHASRILSASTPLRKRDEGATGAGLLRDR